MSSLQSSAPSPRRERRLERWVGGAPNLLPRLTRLAPGFFARRLRRPVFLLGCGRSGKTILAKILGRHPDIALFPDEANHLWHPGLYPWHESPHRQRVPPIWSDARGFARGSGELRTPRDVRLLQGTFGAYQMLVGKRMFLNDSALTAVLLPFILAEFKGAHIIHMVRDGRAVAPAWAQRQYAQIREHADRFRACGLELDYDGVLDRCARSWNQQVVDAARLLELPARQRSGYLFELKYEQFCARPAAVLDRLTRWLAIDPEPLIEGGLDHIENRNATDIGDISPTAAQRIEALMLEGLTLHGYIAIPAVASGDVHVSAAT